MKRHENLIPLSHDHHHVLKQVRGLKSAGRGEDSDRIGRAETFIEFFDSDGVEHFRQEEESVFPLAAGLEEARDALTRALAEHGEIRMMVDGLRAEVRDGDVHPETLLGLGSKLEGHVRLEEKTLFPLIERLVPEEALEAVNVRA